jgi:hypothetical protein
MIAQEIAKWYSEGLMILVQLQMALFGSYEVELLLLMLLHEMVDLV